MGVAVVTGAARGLGLAIATALHRAGYEVLVTDVDGEAAAEAAAIAGRVVGPAGRPLRPGLPGRRPTGR